MRIAIFQLKMFGNFCNIPEQVVDCIEHTLFGRSFNALSPKLANLLKPFLKIQQGSDEFIKKINERFIQKEMQ